MRRIIPALATALVLSGGAAATALATTSTSKTVTLGVDGAKVIAPTCPTSVKATACTIVVGEATVYATMRNGTSVPTEVTANGKITGFSVGVSILTKTASTQATDLANLNSQFFGAPSAELSVLAPVGNPALRRYRVVAKSPAYNLTSYLGKVASFTLATPIPVVRGEVLALTSPTWMPVLTIAISTSNNGLAWSRSAPYCGTTAGKVFTTENGKSVWTGTNASQAQGSVGAMTAYGCLNTGARIEYSATEVTPSS